MILIVDDEQAIADSIAQNLQWAMPEMRIEERPDGGSALEEIRRGNVALLIADYMMPGMNGMDLIAESKLAFPLLSAILMTGYGRPDLKVQALRFGAAYVEKPFHMTTFIDLARSLCQSRNAADGNGARTGIFCDASMDDLIQSCSTLQLDRTLIVAKDERIGTVFLRAGRIIHAEAGAAVGIPALAAMIGWKSSRIEVLEGFLSDRQTIHSASSQDALLEAMRLADANTRRWMGSHSPAHRRSVPDLLNQMGVTEERFSASANAASKPKSSPASSMPSALAGEAGSNSMANGKETWLEQVTRVMQEISLEMPELAIAELIVENRDRIVGMSSIPHAGAAPPQMQGVISLLRNLTDLANDAGLGLLESAVLLRKEACVILAAISEGRGFLAAETPHADSWKTVLVSLRAWAQRIQRMKSPAHI